MVMNIPGIEMVGSDNLNIYSPVMSALEPDPISATSSVWEVGAA